MLAVVACSGVTNTGVKRSLVAASSSGPALSDCILDFGRSVEVLGLDPTFKVEAYNPTAMTNGSRLIGLVRVALSLAAHEQQQPHPLPTALDFLNSEAARDLLVEFEAPLASPCAARMLRVVGEGEDPRMIRGADGRALAHFQQYEHWVVGERQTSNQLVNRQFSLYEWGSHTVGSSRRAQPSASRTVASSRLIFHGETPLSALIGQAAHVALLGEAARDRTNIASREMLVKGLLGSCGILSQLDHLHCKHNGGWREPSFVQGLRVPHTCTLNITGAISSLATAEHSSSDAAAALDVVKTQVESWDTGGTLVDGVVLLQSNGFLSEKNWSPFLYGEGSSAPTLGMLYSFAPFVACTLQNSWEKSLKATVIEGEEQPG